MRSIPRFLAQALRAGATVMLSVMLVLVGCGGGVETGGTGASSTYAEGPITGFGSVIVNGVRFDDRGADVEDVVDGLKSRSDLRLGMVVEIEAGRVSDDGSGGRSATAATVRINPHLVGPVTALDLAAGRIDVLGLPVRLTTATVLDGLSNGALSLRLGQVVEVHGFFEMTMMSMGYVATRVEPRQVAPPAYRVRGIAHAVDTVAKTLQIGNQVFDLAVTGVPGGLADGSFVRLVVDKAQVGDRWSVSRVALEGRRVEDRDEAELEGLITSFTSTASFAVNGIAVDASGASRPASGLAVGTRVKVRGRAAGGVLIASRVELHSDDDAYSDGVDLRGVMSALDTGAKTFLLRGVSVYYGSAPQYEGGSESSLADNVCVRVRAALDAERTRVVATRIEFGAMCQ